MLHFWDSKRLSAAVNRYPIVPLLDLSGILLLKTHQLWHRWSLNKSAALKSIANDLLKKAGEYREDGWRATFAMCSESTGCSSHYSIFMPYRYLDYEVKKGEYPLAVLATSAIVFHVLFQMMEPLEKLQKIHKDTNIDVVFLYNLIERLNDSPCRGDLVLNDDGVRAFALWAVFLECECLAFTHARIEDHYNQKSGKTKKTRCRMTEEEMRKLSVEIDVPIEILRDIFSTEYSSWWDIKDVLKRRAFQEKEKFIKVLPDTVPKDILREYIDAGSVHEKFAPEFWHEEIVTVSLKTTTVLMSQLLSWVNKNRIGGSKLLLKT